MLGKSSDATHPGGSRRNRHRSHPDRYNRGWQQRRNLFPRVLSPTPPPMLREMKNNNNNERIKRSRKRITIAASQRALLLLLIATARNCGRTSPLPATRGNSSSLRYPVRRLLLLHGLVFGESEPHPARHFDVLSGAVFHAGGFRLVQALGAEGVNASLEATLDQLVVHADVAASRQTDTHAHSRASDGNSNGNDATGYNRLNARTTKKNEKRRE